MATAKLSDIVFDESIYPRESTNPDTVRIYVERIMAGDKPPPLVLDNEENKRLYDGKHRFDARVEYNRWYKQDASDEEKTTWPKPVGTMEVVYDLCPEDMPETLWAAHFQQDYGDRLSDTEQRDLAVKVYEDDPDINQGMICLSLKRSTSTVSRWLQHLTERRKREQRTTIAVLQRLGWTHKEIAGCVDLSRPGLQS